MVGVGRSALRALKKAERRDVERYWIGTFLACKLGPYSPFWNGYKTGAVTGVALNGDE
jgi:hypothetical protein